ncbi:hypothetical protein Taro_056003, partial [Colocasia esculenta]|nr:hypothetical protein [Colocasia esculenta]
MAVLPKACRNSCASGAAAALRERNLGGGQEISESGPGPTGLEWRVGIRAHREPLPPSESGIWALDRKSPSPAQGRPGVSESVGIGSRFRPPGAKSGRRIGNLRVQPRADRVGVRFGIGASRAVPITGRGNIYVLPKWCKDRCLVHTPR